MRKLRTIILEANEEDRASLKKILERFSDRITIVNESESAQEVVLQLQKELPDLLFIDIDQPGKIVLNFLEQLDIWNFEVVFTTNSAQHAPRAFNWEVIDFLVKPVSFETLQKTLFKVFNKFEVSDDQRKYMEIREQLPKGFNKLPLPTTAGFVFVDIQEIVRCKASSNYTTFFLESKETILVSKTLKHFENLLSESHFVRINRTDLININFVKQFLRGKKSLIELEDGTRLNLADSRKDDFIQKIS